MANTIGFTTALYTCLQTHATAVVAQTLSAFCLEQLKKTTKFRSWTILSIIPNVLATVLLLALYAMSWSLTMLSSLVELGLVISILFTIMFGQEGDFSVAYYSPSSIQKQLADQSGSVVHMMRPGMKQKIALFTMMIGMLEKYGTICLIIGSVLYLISSFKKLKETEISKDISLMDGLVLAFRVSLILAACQLFVSSIWGIPGVFEQVLIDWSEYKLYHKYKDFQGEL